MQVEQSRDLDLIHNVLSQLYSTVDQLSLEADALRAERDALKQGDAFDTARREVIRAPYASRACRVQLVV